MPPTSSKLPSRPEIASKNSSIESVSRAARAMATPYFCRACQRRDALKTFVRDVWPGKPFCPASITASLRTRSHIQRPATPRHHASLRAQRVIDRVRTREGAPWPCSWLRSWVEPKIALSKTSENRRFTVKQIRVNRRQRDTPGRDQTARNRVFAVFRYRKLVILKKDQENAQNSSRSESAQQRNRLSTTAIVAVEPAVPNEIASHAIGCVETRLNASSK